MTQTTEPKYNLIVNWVKEMVDNGSLRGEDKLPSENELAEKFRMSRQTVRHALNVLEREGITKSKKGSGTYISAKKKADREIKYHNIAVVSTYMDSYIFPSVFRGLESVLSFEGYSMQIAITGNLVSREEAVLKDLLEKDNIDGLIIEPSKSALPCSHRALYEEFAKKSIPILFFNCRRNGFDIPLVAMDDEEIGRKAAAHLIAAGHTAIGGIFKCDDFQGHLRCLGFHKEAAEEGVALEDRNIVWTDTEGILNVGGWADCLFDRIEGCTGVFCYNDELAYKLKELCLKRGISVPEDLSLVGVDHHLLFADTNGDINSFQYPMEKLGQKTAENMLKLIINPLFDANYYFHPDIQDFGSVKKIKETNPIRMTLNLKNIADAADIT